MKKVIVIGGQINYAAFLQDFEIVKNSEKADLVILTGGADVDPQLYGEEPHPTTGTDTARDMLEIKEWKAIKSNNPEILTLGICRGSQLGCVLSGGKLVQHMNHPYTHEVELAETGDKLEVNSTHHQMQYPFNLPDEDYDLIAFANITKNTYAEGVPEGMMNPPVDPEIVFYNKTKILAVQGHPEMIPNSEFAQVVNNLITEFL